MKNGEQETVVNKVMMIGIPTILGLDQEHYLRHMSRSGRGFTTRSTTQAIRAVSQYGLPYSSPLEQLHSRKAETNLTVLRSRGPSYNKKKISSSSINLGRSKDEITGLTKKTLKDGSFSMDGSSESYQICNNYQIYSPGEIWTIYFTNVKEGDTITFHNYYSIVEEDGEYKVDNGEPVTNTFGKEIPFPNTDLIPGDQPCGTPTDPGRCYLMETLIPQLEGKTIYTSPDTKISMNNLMGNGAGNLCQTNNFTLNYAPSGIDAAGY